VAVDYAIILILIKIIDMRRLNGYHFHTFPCSVKALRTQHGASLQGNGSNWHPLLNAKRTAQALLRFAQKWREAPVCPWNGQTATRNAPLSMF